ncbi:MAG: hypothetical protein WCI02_17770, partial [Planctomycetota bacterium]
GYHSVYNSGFYGGFYGPSLGIGMGSYYGGYPYSSSYGYNRPSYGSSYGYNTYNSYPSRMVLVPSQPRAMVSSPRVVDPNTYTGELKPGMVLPDGSVIVSVGPSQPASDSTQAAKPPQADSGK